MAIFKWTDELDIGVRDMNIEHQQILKLMNRLHHLYENKAPKPELATALQDLVTYTIQHFADEEAYMQKIGYDAIETHKLLHKNLLNKLTEFLTAVQSGQKDVSEGLFYFLKFWLTAHIRGIDKKYGEYSLKIRHVG